MRVASLSIPEKLWSAAEKNFCDTIPQSAEPFVDPCGLFSLGPSPLLDQINSHFDYGI
jgi:hypothetical protein